MTVEHLDLDYAGFKRWFIDFNGKASSYRAAFSRLAQAGRQAPLRLGIIGGGVCGAVAFSLLRDVEGIEVVGVGDRDRQAARVNFPDMDVFAAGDRVWDTVDAILVAMAPEHYDEVLKAFEQGWYGGARQNRTVYLMFRSHLPTVPDAPPRVVLSTLPRSGSYWLAYMLGDLLEGQFGYRVCAIDRNEPEADQLSLLPHKGFTWNHYTVEAVRPWLDDDRYTFIYLYRGLRDQLVSWSRYTRNNTKSGSRPLRRYLGQFSEDDALALFITGGTDVLDGEGIELPSLATTAAGVHAWLEQAATNPRVAAVRYEALVETPHLELARLFRFLELPVGHDALAATIEKHQFRHLTRGREAGQEDPGAHFRKGIVGDYRNHFTPLHDALVRLLVPSHLRYLL